MHHQAHQQQGPQRQYQQQQQQQQHPQGLGVPRGPAIGQAPPLPQPPQPFQPTLRGFILERKTSKELGPGQDVSWEWINVTQMPYSQEELASQVKEYRYYCRKYGTTLAKDYEALRRGHRRAQIDKVITENTRRDPHFPWAQYKLMSLRLDKKPIDWRAKETTSMRIILKRQMREDMPPPEAPFPVNIQMDPRQGQQPGMPGMPGAPMHQPMNGMQAPPPPHGLHMPPANGNPGVPPQMQGGPPPVPPPLPYQPQGAMGNIQQPGVPGPMMMDPRLEGHQPGGKPQKGGGKKQQFNEPHADMDGQPLAFDTKKKKKKAAPKAPKQKVKIIPEDSSSESDDSSDSTLSDESDFYYRSGDEIVHIIEKKKKGAKSKGKKQKKADRKASRSPHRKVSMSFKPQILPPQMMGMPPVPMPHMQHAPQAPPAPPAPPMPASSNAQGYSTRSPPGSPQRQFPQSPRHSGEALPRVPEQPQAQQPVFNINILGNSPKTSGVRPQADVTKKVNEWSFSPRNSFSASELDFNDAGASTFSNHGGSDFTNETPPSPVPYRDSFHHNRRGSLPRHEEPQPKIRYREHSKPAAYSPPTPPPPAGRGEERYPNVAARGRRYSEQQPALSYRPEPRRALTFDNTVPPPRDPLAYQSRVGIPPPKHLPAPPRDYERNTWDEPPYPVHEYRHASDSFYDRLRDQEEARIRHMDRRREQRIRGYTDYLSGGRDRRDW